MYREEFSTQIDQHRDWSAIHARLLNLPKQEPPKPTQRVIVERRPLASCGRSSCEIPPRFKLFIKPFCHRATLIQAVVEAHFNLPRGTLVKGRRLKQHVMARQIAMYLCRTLEPQLSTPEIGRRFGGRDHTTVLYSFHKIEECLASDPTLSAVIEQIKARVAERLA